MKATKPQYVDNIAMVTDTWTQTKVRTFMIVLYTLHLSNGLPIDKDQLASAPKRVHSI